jgi:hypothetical protein
MPNSLRELHETIVEECDKNGLSLPQIHFAVGWIFHDVFERADHDEANNGITVGPGDFDRYAKDIPGYKILRDIHEAQQVFGRSAASFMEDEIQKRISEAIDNSVVSTVRSFTTWWKPFLVNVSAGVVAGVLFAAITLAGYFW